MKKKKKIKSLNFEDYLFNSYNNIVDIDNKNIYDYDLFKKGEYKIIGTFDNLGKFIKS